MKIAVKYPLRSYSTQDLRAWIAIFRPHFNEKVVATYCIQTSKRSPFTTTINETSIITSNVRQKIVVFSLLFLFSNLN
jgi:hypothetical protein